MVALTGDELQAWVETTSQGWKAFVAEKPAVLVLPCDIRETSSVAELLQHIVAVELRYAERLHGIEETPYEQISYESGEAIFGTHDRAMSLLKDLEGKDNEFWNQWIDFMTRKGGSISVPRRTVFVHLLMHSVRHYAQLATLVRQHGFAFEQSMDYLVMRPKAPVL